MGDQYFIIYCRFGIFIYYIINISHNAFKCKDMNHNKYGEVEYKRQNILEKYI